MSLAAKVTVAAKAASLLQPNTVQRNGVKLFLKMHGDKTGGYGHKSQLGKIQMDIRKAFSL